MSDSNYSSLLQMAWIFFVTISNIVTDLIIFAQAMILISSIQTSLKRRLIFAGIFVPRLLWVLPEFSISNLES